MSVSVKTLHDGPVSGACGVTIPVAREQADELRKALGVVQRYENAARKAAKIPRKGYGKPDWVMFGYAVKNDKVIVRVEDGACG